MQTVPQNTLTAQEIADALEVPLWKANYLLLREGVKPVRRAGVTRLYAADVVATLRKAEVKTIKRVAAQ